MKHFFFLLLLVVARQVLPAQCTAPIVIASGPTAICPGSSVTLSLPTYNVWTQKTDFGGIARIGAVGFSIGSNGYMGTGEDITKSQKDFWVYNAVSNSWTQKADFGGGIRSYACGFSIGSKGYIGTGYDVGSNYKKDFWEYDTTANTWTKKADFGGTARILATGFSISTKGYIGTGLDGGYKKDFWEYTPTTNSWVQKADFGGVARNGAVGFSVGGKGYIGTGLDAGLNYKKDFWEYNQVANTWVQKTDFGGTSRQVATGFSIGSKGYIGLGYNDITYYQKDFWEYNPTTDIWLKKANFGGSARYGATGFSIANQAFIGAGLDASSYEKDFWVYNPEQTYLWSPGGQTSAAITVNNPGTYTVTVTNPSGCAATSAATLVSFNIPKLDTIGPTTLCSGGSVTLSVEGNIWTQKANFGGMARRGSSSFSIGAKGYVGTGLDNNNTYYKDFWEFDPVANAWTQKADFGGGARGFATGLTIGNKGYIGTGIVYDTYKKDFWEFDPATNMWTQKADFGGIARLDPTSFSIGSYGYIGTGSGDGNVLTKDVWEYNQAADSWAQKADFGGTARYQAAGFSIGTKGYIGTGGGFFDYQKDFWEYNQSSDTWTRKADYGGLPRRTGVSFTIGNKGYIGLGTTSAGTITKKEIWEYNPVADNWVQKADFTGGGERGYAIGFSIGDKGYAGMGWDGFANLKNDLWEFNPGYTYAWVPGGQTTAAITVNTASTYAVTTTGALGCVVTSSAVISQFSDTIFVDSSIAVSGNGTSWSKPFKKLTEAFAAAGSCSSVSQINVAKGTYYPTADNQRDSSFIMPHNGIRLYGGYPSGGGIRNTAINPTILSGNIGNQSIAADNSYHILLISATATAKIDSTTRVDGFTITGGTASDFSVFNGVPQSLYRDIGGGIYCYGQGVDNSCKPLIANCIFTGNLASNRGGAIFNDGYNGGNSSSYIINCSFLGNNAGYASGSGGSSAGGAAVYNNADGGGISSPSFINCSMYGNYSYTSTGGALCNFGTNAIPTITNTIIYLNNNSTGNSNISNINGATFNISYSIVQGGPGGSGNINANPLFANPAAGDLRLQECSPAINSGNNAALPAGTTTDLAGNSRIFDATVDMGSYEYQRLPTTLAINGDVASRTVSGLLSASLATNCRLIATVQPNGASPLSGNLTAKAWVDAVQSFYNSQRYLKRHCELTPATNIGTATARITLFATQQEFNDFNAAGNSDLPTGPTNTAGIANLRIFKYSGQSSNGSGTPGSYAQPGTMIDPDDNNIVWNSSQNRWEITFDVTGFSGFFIGSNGSSILPLTLLSFSGKAWGNDAQLSWRTDKEVNVHYFELQRSTDGSTFTALALVQPKGTATTPADYSYTDKNLSGGWYYYRLRMVDKDGKETYSSVLPVVVESGKSITLYPVPAKDDLWLGGSGSRIGSTVVLSDAQGRTLQSFRITQWPQHIDLRALSSGTYFLKLQGESGIKFTKNE